MGEKYLQMLAQNTQLTEQIARLTGELHQALCREPNPKILATDPCAVGHILHASISQSRSGALIRYGFA